MQRRILFCLIGIVLISSGAALAKKWDFPPLPPPAHYGNILINRISVKNGERAVTFSHWLHRMRDTCRVCHFELEFQMQVNATEITEEKNKQGQFCGACHDGKKVFGHTREHCKKCHNGNIAYGEEMFKDIAHFPEAPYGNNIDWVEALKQGLIKPRHSILDENYAPMGFNKKLDLEARWAMIPPAIFPHEVHKQWLDCSNCHPDIFNVKKKSTEHFEMKFIIAGKFCGVCHLKVAFPLDDCTRCHPKMKRIR